MFPVAATSAIFMWVLSQIVCLGVDDDDTVDFQRSLWGGPWGVDDAQAAKVAESERKAQCVNCTDCAPAYR
jgi:hypothetical protein